MTIHKLNSTAMAVHAGEMARALMFFLPVFLLYASLGRTQERQTGTAQISELGRENLSRAAASATDIKAVLIKDAGLMVELKRWIAKDATGHGQIIGDSDLTDEAIFDQSANCWFRNEQSGSRRLRNRNAQLPARNEWKRFGTQPSATRNWMSSATMNKSRRASSPLKCSGCKKICRHRTLPRMI